MSIQLDNPAAAPGVPGYERRLLLIWQNPSTRIYQRVGRLVWSAESSYRFSYLHEAEDSAFFPLDEYPDVYRVYESSALPAFFANRVMSSERHNYDQYLSWLGLNSNVLDELPIEILVRTGGGRATDLFHVVEEPDLSNGRFESRFFVSGLSHIEGSSSRVAELEAGDQLLLRDDSDNSVNPRAILLDSRQSEPVGWVPDWLCGELRDLVEAGFVLDAHVERVSPEAPAHIRVMCRINGAHVS